QGFVKLARGLLLPGLLPRDVDLPHPRRRTIRSTPTTMTPRYLMKLRALTAAAIAFAAVPLSLPAFGQDEPAPPVTEEVTPAAEAPAEPEEAAEPEAGSLEEYLAHVATYNPVDEEGNVTDLSAAFDFFAVSMLWTCIGAALVFIMHLGFATLEAGLTQKKNTVNIIF